MKTEQFLVVTNFFLHHSIFEVVLKVKMLQYYMIKYFIQD